jgi:hypothetical protein
MCDLGVPLSYAKGQAIRYNLLLRSAMLNLAAKGFPLLSFTQELMVKIPTSRPVHSYLLLVADIDYNRK